MAKVTCLWHKFEDKKEVEGKYVLQKCRRPGCGARRIILLDRSLADKDRNMWMEEADERWKKAPIAKA